MGNISTIVKPSSADAPENPPVGVVAARIRNIVSLAAAADLPIVAALAEEVGYLLDRVEYAEAEVLHLRHDLDLLTAKVAEVPE